jgi:UDP-N-acetylmuramate dehydrogenase
MNNRRAGYNMAMQPKSNISLSQFSTMRLGGMAEYAQEVTSANDLKDLVNWAAPKNLPILMIGRGSNIVWRDEGFNGLLLVNKIMGFDVELLDGDAYMVSVGAGEDWDSVVARTVEKGLSGIEALSLIPGTTGATPIQNVGAYGQEIAQVLDDVEAFDTQTNELTRIAGSDCQFGYRISRFKTSDKGRFFITSLKLKLIRSNPKPPFYPSLQQYLDDNHITEFTPQTIRDAVVAIRQAKLPDPEKVANNGSFFFNPVVEGPKLNQIKGDYPEVVFWPVASDQFKLSAAWLIESAGFRDFHDNDTGMATWPKQSLVLVNEHAKNTADLLKFASKIISAVQQKFGVMLEREPLLLPEEEPIGR